VTPDVTCFHASPGFDVAQQIPADDVQTRAVLEKDNRRTTDHDQRRQFWLGEFFNRLAKQTLGQMMNARLARSIVQTSALEQVPLCLGQMPVQRPTPKKRPCMPVKSIGFAQAISHKQTPGGEMIWQAASRMQALDKKRRQRGRRRLLRLNHLPNLRKPRPK
jgi:hypothetical protein